AFMDVTDYLSMYRLTAKELGLRILGEIYEKLRIRATCGIGTNIYLAKIALDISAKHSPDFVGELTEQTYRETLWNHRPLTDFWRVGAGTAQKLAGYGIFTMGDIAHADEDFLYHLFGIDAELLIDHAWGIEPTGIADIKAYKPVTNCLSSGQVLSCDYPFEEGKLIVKEMMDLLCLDMVEKKLVTRSVTLHVGYANRLNVPSAHGTTSLTDETNSDLLLIPAVTSLYERIVNPQFPLKRVNISCNNVVPEEFHQYSFFTDAEELERNRKVQEAVISIKKKFGKNAILKGMNLEEHATTRERNTQIGGHRSGETT
ncbi:MAG: DNA repair protein, partial [Lachnospiraceae bacterium]|nr:DNA repair protein [Lachnospiraceae bacterium]